VGDLTIKLSLSDIIIYPPKVIYTNPVKAWTGNISREVARMGYERGVKKGPLWEVFELLKAGYTVVFPLESGRVVIARKGGSE